MIGDGFKKSLFFRIVNLFLVFTFSFYNISFAVTEKNVKPSDFADPRSALSVDDIGIAIDCGTIKSKYSGDSGRTVVHIQDAHCNYEAQSNINRMLAQLTKECGINIISVEGSEGIIDTAWFRAFPDSEIRKEVATYFMKKGEITGAEFFSIISDYKGTIFGAETRDYYVKNLKAFTEVYPYKDMMEKYFINTRTIADRLKSIVYPPKLKELDSRIKAFDDKELELSDYADYLNRTASKNRVNLKDYPNFEKLIQTLEYEKKIDFDIVDQERSEYIDALGKKLSKEEMTELVTQSIRFKKGHIKAVEFYFYLRELAKEHDIPMMQEYPNLFYYYIYTKLYDGIDNESLFREIDTVEARLKEKLFGDEVQEKLDKYASMLDMYVDLVNIELTNEDYDLFKTYSKEFSLGDVLAFLEKLCDKYSLNYAIDGVPAQISENLPNMVDFYEIAMKRDNALIDNTLDQMDREGKNRCVLIAGGFHTRGIKDILEKKGVSYVVVTPKITKDVETPYIKVLTNQRTSLEDIITESAVMPGPEITTSREAIARPKADMLSPLLRVAYTVPLYLEKTEDLKTLSDTIGPIEGRTLLEVTEESYREMVSALVRGWLVKVKQNAAPEVWAKAVENWPLLLGVYLKKYEEAAKEEGIEPAKGLRVPEVVLTEDALGTISEEFRGIFKGVVIAERTTPGTEALRTYRGYAPLTPAQHKGVNKVIEDLFSSVESPQETVTLEIEGEKYPIKVFALEGFKEAIEAYNESPAYGETIPLDIEVHPGRGPSHRLEGASMYMSLDGYNALTKEQIKRLALHELYHILFVSQGEQADEEAVIGAMKGDDLDDIRKELAKVERKRAEEKLKVEEDRIISETPGAREVLDNIGFATSAGEKVKIAVVVSGSEVDQENWQERLDRTSSNVFNPDGSSLVLSLQEKIGDKTREGNFLGTLLAYRHIKKAADKAGIPYKDYVTMIGMLFGRGERMSPITQAEGDRKPAISVTPATMEIKGREGSLAAIEEALLYFTPVVQYLEKRGFRGVLDKWGDETEIASIDLTRGPGEGESLAQQDVMKVISVLKLDDITDPQAVEKDWVIFDEDGNMLAQVSRNKNGADALRKDLKAKMGEFGIDLDYVGISLGPVAVSYDVLDIASEVFAEEIEKEGIYFDFDPYFLMALAMEDDPAKWDAAVKADKGLQKLVDMVSGFFGKVQNIKKIFREKHGRDLNLKILDLGGNVYWADIGQHSAMREKYLALNDKGARGVIARKVANIPGVRDENGNIIVDSEISPDVKVKDSVIVNSKITGKGTITGSVIMDSELDNVKITDAFAVRSARLGNTVLEKKCGIYNSLGVNDLTLKTIEKIEDGETKTYGMRHISVLTSKGKIDMEVAENTDLRDKKNTYNVPIFGNDISFEDAYNEMFGVSMEELERRRTEELAKLNRIKEKTKKFEQLSFGTSGLRDTVENMTDMECYINARGFIRSLIDRGLLEKKDTISIAGDLRSSTPRIMNAVAKAVEDEGKTGGYELKLDFCGFIPSPTAALRGRTKGSISIMVTGSHIPFNMNGVKFYKKSGEEVLKGLDERTILEGVAGVRKEEYARSWEESLFDEKGMFKSSPEYDLTANQSETEEQYVNRYLNAFPKDALAGVEVVLYEHSAVGNDILKKIYERLGAKVIAVGKSEKFIAIDTEKITPTLKDILEKYSNPVTLSEELTSEREWTIQMITKRPFAVTFTDGDKDRPGLADENGNFLTGDKLGLLVAKLLRPTFAAIPVSSNKGVVEELRKMGIKVVLTKIGSPHVIKAMNDELAVNPDAKALGWEANGGFLLGSTFAIPGGGELTRFATRDAVLPLVSAIYLSKNPGKILGKKGPMKMSELIDTEIPHIYNYASVYDKFQERFKTDRATALATMRAIVPALAPKLNDDKVVAIDFDEGTAERRIEKEINGEKVLTFETEKVKIDDLYKKDDPDLKEWYRVKEKLGEVFTSEAGFAEVKSVNILDGVQVTFRNGEISHLRPSGNAPEFRNYAMAAGQERAEEIVAVGVEDIIPVLADEVWAARAHKTVERALTPGIYTVRTMPPKDTPADRVLYAILQRREPVGVLPYKQPKVWGVNGIGEYWYGAEIGEKSSVAKVGEDAVPMAELMQYAPEEILGEAVTRNFGERLPLVKILTPKDRLSLQFHDAKNELWIVTGIDKSLAGKTPSIIVGFSQKAVDKYGRDVTKEYGKALENYGEKLNKLIDLLETRGYKDLLGETRNVVVAAQRVMGKEHDIKEALGQLYSARGQLESFYNYRAVKVGDVVPVPAGTLHALTAGIEVVEPQIAGPTQSLEDGATYPVRYYFPGYQRPGAQKKLDIDRVGEMNPAVVRESEPEIIAEGVERLPGMFERKGLEVHRITLEKGRELKVPESTSFHTLVTVKGKARVIIGEKTYDIPKASPGGEMLIIPATVASYKIIADEPSQVIDTFTPVAKTQEVPVATGDKVPGTDEHEWTEGIVYADYENDMVPDTYVRLDIIGVREMRDMKQEHTLIVQSGKVKITSPVEEIPPLDEGQSYTFKADYPDYRIVRLSDQPARVKIDFENTRAENIVYATYDMVRKHIDTIKAAQIDLILPQEMFVPGGKNTPGSAKWEQEQLQKFISDRIRITTYSARMGLEEAAGKSINEGAVGILVATESNIREADRNNAKIQDFLFGKKGTVRVLAIPDIDKAEELEGKGWYFNREVEGTALLLAAVTPEQIKTKGEGNAADDLQKLMTQLTGQVIPREYLYYMLSHDEMGDARNKLPAAFKEDTFGWLLFLVNNLLLKMPIRPFDATDQLYQRRKVMWSV